MRGPRRGRSPRSSDNLAPAAPKGGTGGPAQGRARRASCPNLSRDTLATVAAGRTALVARLRAIAARLEALPLNAAEVLLLLEPAAAAFEQHAALALERAPTGAQ